MSQSVKVKYFDPSGESHDGYIIDNKTYKDSQGTQRVDLGSVVETANGNYVLTKNGGVKQGTQSNYSKLAQDSILNAKQNANLAIKKALEQQTQTIENNKKQTKKQYNDLVKQMNLKKKLSEKNMSDILEAQGIKGGMSESSLIANNVNYENSINELTEALQNTLSDYDNELLELQKNAQYNILMSDSKYDELYSEYLRENAKNEYEDFLNDRTLNSQNFTANRNYNLKKEKNAYTVEKDLRDYLRSVYEDDRDFEYTKYWNEKNFDWDAKNDDRNYTLNKIKAYK